MASETFSATGTTSTWRVELAQPLGRLLDARLAEAGMAHEELAVEIVGPEIARVGEDEPADARGGEM